MIKKKQKRCVVYLTDLNKISQKNQNAKCKTREKKNIFDFLTLFFWYRLHQNMMKKNKIN